MSYKYLQRLRLSTPQSTRSAIYLILRSFFFFFHSRHQNMTNHSCIISTQDQDKCDDDIDCWEDRHLQPHPLNGSRLSVCSGSSIYGGAEDDNFYGDGNCSYQAIEEDLSRLSMEIFDGDGVVDKEFSDKEKRAKESLPSELLFSDSDKEPGCYSFSGENEGPGSNSTCGAGLVVITRPKGGRRALCMDLDEVKACRDLGFEMEHERMLELPSASRLSLSTTSNLDTASSGGNSPIANWRISNPGDDPRDVKSRLKVWAQAVALASTSRQGD